MANFGNYVRGRIGTSRRAIKKGVGVAGSYISYSKRSKSRLKGQVADIKAVDMYMKKIPRGISQKVRNKAKADISRYVKVGNYVRAREYIKKLSS